MCAFLTRGPPIKGARMPPTRPHMDDAPRPAFRTSVGKSSTVYTYMALKAMVTPALPSKESTVTDMGEAGRNEKA